MPDTSPILNLPYILPAQAQKHVTHNEAIRLLDMIVQLSVASRTLTVPPATPAVADRYIVGSGATGSWAGQDDRIAVWDTTGWVYVTPQAGWQAYVVAEAAAAVFDGTTWAVLGLPSQLPLLGVNATADVANRLTVSSAATLLNNAGAGHQVKVNKAAPTDTASLLFQTGFSGRAEMGLAGNDDFSIKVSADGSLFQAALQADAATGSVNLPQPLRLGGQTADPVAPGNGTLWLNTTTGEVKLRTAGATIAVGAGGGGGALGDGDKGDVTVSGAGTVWTVDAGAISLGKMADLAAGSIIGRITAGTGVPETLSATQARSLLNVADGATANSADAVLQARANHTGTQPAATISGLAAVAVSGSAADMVTGILPAGRFDDAAHGLRAGGALHAVATTTVAGFMAGADKTKLDGIATGANAYAHPDHGGDVASVGDGPTTISAGVVSNTKLAAMAAHTVKANGAGIAASPVDLAIGANTVLGRLGGDVVAAQLQGAQIADAAITDDKLANVATGTLKGRVTAGTGGLETLSGAQATTLLDLFASGAKGLVPASGGGTANFLRADGVWAAPPGGSSAPLGLADFWDSYRIVPTITQYGTFLGAAISSGTNTTAIPAGASFGHNPWGALVRSSTTANSGYRYMTSVLNAMYFGGGVSFKSRTKFLWRTFTNNTIRMGFHDTLTITDTQDGAYFEVIGNVIACKTAIGATRTQDPVTFTVIADRVYTLDVEVNDTATAAQFRVYENLNATPVLDQTITTNIPNAFVRAFGAGIVATNAGTVASEIGIIYELGVGTVPAFQRAVG